MVPTRVRALHVHCVAQSNRKAHNIQRSLTPTELMLMQGFAIRGCLGDVRLPANQIRTSSFQHDRQRYRPTVVGQVGNAMHVHIAGFFLIYATFFCRPAKMLGFDEFLSFVSKS